MSANTSGSMWFVRTKARALKVYEICKNYAALALLFVLLAFAILAAKNKQKTIELLATERQRLAETHRQQLESIQATVDREQARRRQIEQQYNDLMAKIEREHDEGVRRIAAQHRSELRAAITRNQDDPDKMAVAINGIFGLPVVDIKPVSTP
jgi:uncharacterized protein YlxW (UPF0749 family)